MRKWMRAAISVVSILGLGVAALVFIKLRSQATQRTALPPDLMAGIEEGEAALERMQALGDIRKVLKAAPEEGMLLLWEFMKEHPGTQEASEARLLFADALVKKGDTKGALAQLQIVIDDPKAARRATRARIERARIKAGNSEDAAARRDLEWVLRDECHPDLQHVARLELGLLDLKSGEFLRAINTLTPLTERNYPEKEAALEAIREAIRGQTKKLAKSGDPRAVLRWGGEMIKKFPDLAGVRNDIRYHQAIAVRELGRLVEARHIIERLKRDVPPDLLGEDIQCDAELQRILEAEVAAGIARTREAFLKAKSAGQDHRAEFEGDIAADTHWGKDRSPLVLTGNVTVRRGATLTIEPGVTVAFVLGARLVVEGALVARGAADQPVRFSSVATKSPSFFDGEGIEFTDSGADESCRLEHCIIEYQRVGVTCRGASPTIRRCVFTRNGSLALLATGGAEPRVDERCVFEENDGTAIRAEGSNVTVRRCLILKNGVEGIRLAKKCKGLLEGNRINGNAGHGIACDDASPTVQANEIAANGGDGIHCDHFSHPRIQGNVIRENRGSAVRCLSDSTSTITGNLIEGNLGYPIVLEESDGVIQANNILGNRPYGINCAKSASPQIEGNWIEGNGGCGIICSEGSAPTITGNAIVHQGRAISNAGKMPVQAAGNYFGDVDDKKVEQLIFDQGDEKGLGEVLWRPRLKDPPPRPPKPQLELPPLP